MIVWNLNVQNFCQTLENIIFSVNDRYLYQENFNLLSVVRYSIASGDKNGLFAINDRTGVISSTKSLDHETQAFVLLSIRAEAGDPPVFATAQVRGQFKYIFFKSLPVHVSGIYCWS